MNGRDRWRLAAENTPFPPSQISIRSCRYACVSIPVSLRNIHRPRPAKGRPQWMPGRQNKTAENIPQAAFLSVEQLVRYAKTPEWEKLLTAMNAALEELNTP